MKKIQSLVCALLSLSPVFPLTALAARPLGGNTKDKMINYDTSFAAKVGFQDIELPYIIATLVEMFLGILAIIFLVLVFYGGYKWMMARGNEREVEMAKDIIRRAIIGLIITLSSYAISYFVLYWLSTAGTGIGTPAGP